MLPIPARFEVSRTNSKGRQRKTANELFGEQVEEETQKWAPSQPSRVATPPPPLQSFSMCVSSLSSSCVATFTCNPNDTVEQFQLSAIQQLKELLKDLESPTVFTRQNYGGVFEFPPSSYFIEDKYTKNEIEHKRIPILTLKEASVPLIEPFNVKTITRCPTSYQQSDLVQIPITLEPLDENERSTHRKTLINEILMESFAKLTNYSNDDAETILFKNEIFPTAKKIQPKLKLSFLYALTTHVPWPSSLDTTFRILIYFPAANVSKTIQVDQTWKVGDTIGHLVSSSQLRAIQTRSADSLIVKFCDTNEFLHEDMTWGMINYVRDYIKRNRELKFTILEYASLEPTYGKCQRNYDAFYQTKARMDFFKKLEEPAPPSTAVPSTSIDKCFQIRLVRLHNLGVQFPNLMGVDQNSFQVSVEFFHGTQGLCAPIWSNARRSGKFNSWVSTVNLKVCQLPRGTKVGFTVHLKNVKEMVPFGWVNVQLFDYHSIMKTGSLRLPLWLGDRASGLGTCSLNTCVNNAVALEIEFEDFAEGRQIIFPSYHLTHVVPHIEDKDMVLHPAMKQLVDQDITHHWQRGEKKMLWDNRKLLSSVPRALPNFLHCIDWKDHRMAREALQLMHQWAPFSGIRAAKLLDAHFAVKEIREYAVSCLQGVPDAQIIDYLLQFVQVLKYEPYHDSSLSRFLLQRGLQNRERIGHLLFWLLKAELAMPSISLRHTLITEAYLYGCGDHLLHLYRQTRLVDKLNTIAESVKKKKKDKDKREVLRIELNKLDFPNPIHLPIIPSLLIDGINVEQCKFMDSFTFPLWLDCKNLDPRGRSIKMIFKSGDDLRADILTLQMFKIMDGLWKEAGLDLNLSPYMCTASANEAGMIEVVQDAVTIAGIHKEEGVVTGALKKTPLAKWLRSKNPTDEKYDKAVDNFVSSLAGYCVATYILGIGDRHNDNIMITRTGFLFHIDFAHILGNVQMWQGFKRERAPFVLTPEFLYVMGKRKSLKFKRFVNLCCKAYNVLRKNSNLFITLFSMMLSTGIPELKNDEDINYLRNSFSPGKTDKEAARIFADLIDESLNTKATQVNFLIHNLAHAGS